MGLSLITLHFNYCGYNEGPSTVGIQMRPRNTGSRSDLTPDLMAHILSNTINYLVPLLPIVMIVIFTDFTRLAFVISGFLDPFSYSSREGNGCNFESFWTQGILNPSWPPPPRFVLIFSRYCSVFSFLFSDSASLFRLLFIGVLVCNFQR